jgi:hypothetical protein
MRVPSGGDGFEWQGVYWSKSKKGNYFLTAAGNGLDVTIFYRPERETPWGDEQDASWGLIVEGEFAKCDFPSPKEAAKYVARNYRVRAN